MYENLIDFGKHRGRPYSCIPIDYLKWIVSATDRQEAIAYATEELERRFAGGEMTPYPTVVSAPALPSLLNSTVNPNTEPHYILHFLSGAINSIYTQGTYDKVDVAITEYIRVNNIGDIRSLSDVALLNYIDDSGTEVSFFVENTVVNITSVN